MLVNVIVPQRLLNHQQVQVVHLRQMIRVCQRVRAVRVQHQRNVGQGSPYPARQFHVPARLNLQLDAAVALCQPLIDDRQCCFHARLDADAHPDNRFPA